MIKTKWDVKLRKEVVFNMNSDALVLHQRHIFSIQIKKNSEDGMGTEILLVAGD